MPFDGSEFSQAPKLRVPPVSPGTRLPVMAWLQRLLLGDAAA